MEAEAAGDGGAAVLEVVEAGGDAGGVEGPVGVESPIGVAESGLGWGTAWMANTSGGSMHR